MALKDVAVWTAIAAGAGYVLRWVWVSICTAALVLRCKVRVTTRRFWLAYLLDAFTAVSVPHKASDPRALHVVPLSPRKPAVLASVVDGYFLAGLNHPTQICEDSGPETLLENEMARRWLRERQGAKYDALIVPMMADAIADWPGEFSVRVLLHGLVIRVFDHVVLDMDQALPPGVVEEFCYEVFYRRFHGRLGVLEIPCPMIARATRSGRRWTAVRRLIEDPRCIPAIVARQQDMHRHRPVLYSTWLESNRREGDATLEFGKYLMGFVGGFLLSSIPTTTLLLLELARHQEFQERARYEVQQATSGELASGDVANMPLVTAFIKEAFRYAGPISGQLRTVYGRSVNICLKDMMRREDLYRDPEVFDPTRFVNAEPDAATRPFGVGPRSCPAQSYSWTNYTTIVASVLLQHRVRLTDDAPPLADIYESTTLGYWLGGAQWTELGRYLRFEPLQPTT